MPKPSAAPSESRERNEFERTLMANKPEKAKWKQMIDLKIALMSNRELLYAVYEAAAECGADEQPASHREFYFYKRATDVLERRLIGIGFLAVAERVRGKGAK